MSRIHRQVLPVVAGAVSICALAGCPNAGTQPPLNATSTASPVATASQAATSTASSPAATPSSSPATDTSAAPSSDAGASSTASAKPASAPPASGATTILQGDVYNEAAATVDGATVTVKSLDARTPYTATINAVQGHYVTNNVPVGVQLQISVAKPNWTTRTRVTALQLNANQRNTLNFGGPKDAPDDAGGAPYFISNYPEVASTVPAPETTKGEKVSYKLRISEPLSEPNRKRLENGLAISSGSIKIDKTSTFLQARERVTMVWNADGTELTLTFNAPLKTKRTDKMTYSVAINRAAGDDLIVDNENNVLGFIAPNPSSAYSKGIKLASLKFTGTEANATDRWNSTHTAGSGFDVAKDEVKPTLVAVNGARVTTAGADYVRVEMTMSKAMMTYPDVTLAASGAPLNFPVGLAGTDSSVTTIGNYAFAISDAPIKGLDMDKILTSPTTITNATTATDSTNLMKASTPFKVDANNGHVQISTGDPKVVQFDIKKDKIPTEARYIRVRVDTAVLDPQGNRMSETNKNSTDLTADNVKDGTI